jgi:hypothetical protein
MNKTLALKFIQGAAWISALFFSACATPRPPEVFPHITEPYFTFILGGNLSEVEKSPDRYIGLFHSIDGQIINIQEDESAVLMTVLVTTNFSVSQPTYVPFIVRLKKPLYDASGLVSYTSISKGDYVSLIGFFAGATSGTNAYGGPVNYVRFDAVAAHINYRKPVVDYAMPQFEEQYKSWRTGQLWYKTAPFEWKLPGVPPDYRNY